MPPRALQFLRSLLDLKPDWYLMELQDEMMIRLGKPVNISAIVRTMERIGTTYKKVRGSQSRRRRVPPARA